MKVLVPVKRVVDANVKVRVKADDSGVDLTNIKMSINQFDEIAVEEAVPPLSCAVPQYHNEGYPASSVMAQDVAQTMQYTWLPAARPLKCRS